MQDMAPQTDGQLEKRPPALENEGGAIHILAPEKRGWPPTSVVDRLANEFPVAAELVKPRFFAGMTLGDAAEALRLPRRTADRHWAFARAWLARELSS